MSCRAYKSDAPDTAIASRFHAGRSCLVATNGNVIFAKGDGLANREHDIANTTDTIFRLASVTKQFTAMCILILQEEGADEDEVDNWRRPFRLKTSNSFSPSADKAPPNC